MSPPVDVVIASTRALMSRALHSVALDAGLNAVRAPCTEELTGVVERLRPPVITIDLLTTMPGEVEAATACCCREARRPDPSIRILLIVDAPVESVVNLVRLGARGVFTPDTRLDLFPDAVRAVGRGEAWLSRSQTGALLDDLAATPLSDVQEDPARLLAAPTTRELQILSMLAQGFGHEEIAVRLFLSPHTARTHIRNVIRKLGAHNRMDAVQVAIRSGLIDVEN